MATKYLVGAICAAVFVCNFSTFGYTITPSLEKTILTNAPKLDPKVLDLGIKAYEHAREKGLDNQELLTIIDYSKPSAERRLWVINMANGNVPFNVHVAHGKGSGLDVVKHFSNQPQTDASSIGIYEAGQTYNGKHGFSMRLMGLEKGFNNNMYKRTIVMHSAWYVTPTFEKKYGRLGRSWGCPALNPETAKPLINKIKNGSIIMAYYPDKQWIANSEFLQKA